MDYLVKAVYSTGPVENAAANASTSTWVKVLNLSENQDISVDIEVFRLNGQKSPIATSSFTVFPLSSDFDVFDILDVLQYEVQVTVSDSANALVTVWGKDANANLLAAHRFVQNELNIINTNTIKVASKAKTTNRNTSRSPNRRTNRR